MNPLPPASMGPQPADIRRWRSLAHALLTFGPACGLTLAPALAEPLRGVDVAAVSENANISLIKRDSRSQVLEAGQVIKNGDKIEVPAKSGGRTPWAILEARQPSLQAKIMGLSQKTTWFLPCTLNGAGILVWSRGDKSACAPPGVQIRHGSAFTSLLAWPQPVIASAGATSGGRIAQLFQPTTCSAMDDTGKQARTAVSLLGEAPCQKAVAECEQATGAPGSCVVVSEGRWQSRSVAFAQCGDQLTRYSEVEAVLTAISTVLGNANSCVLHLLEPGDALLVPEASEGRTAIAFESNAEGVRISAIEGRVRVVSPRTNDWRSLNAGETFQARNGRVGETKEELRGSELCQDPGLLEDGAPSFRGIQAQQHQQLSPQEGMESAPASTLEGEFARLTAAHCLGGGQGQRPAQGQGQGQGQDERLR